MWGVQTFHPYSEASTPCRIIRVPDLLPVSAKASYRGHRPALTVFPVPRPDVSWSAGSIDEFVAVVTFDGSRATISVSGEVDILTAPDLSGVVFAVLDGGRRNIVLDLADCSFIGAAGLDVIARAARRVTPAGGSITIRSPSATTRRILSITGLDQLVGVVEPAQPPARLGLEQPVADRVVRSPGVRPAKPWGMTAMSADQGVVDAALQLVVALTAVVIGGADGVSVSLQRHGHLATVAASDQTILDMDADQYQAGEGPCVDASVHGHWFHIDSLEHDTRWPVFVPQARRLGINAILSNPLVAGDRPVGALNIYSRTSGAFDLKDQELATVLAREASTILTGAGAGEDDDLIAGRLEAALRSREVIAQAQGILMSRDGLGSQQGYAVLQAESRRSNRPMHDLAEELVAETLHLVSPAVDRAGDPHE